MTNPTNNGPAVPRTRTRPTQPIPYEPMTPDWLREQYRRAGSKSR